MADMLIPDYNKHLLQFSSNPRPDSRITYEIRKGLSLAGVGRNPCNYTVVHLNKLASGKVSSMDSISTLIQLQEKIGHRQRLTDGLSNPRIVAPTLPAFPHVQSNFLNIYTKENLNELEKEFLQ